VGLRIATNVASINTQRQMIGNGVSLNKAMQRLSSGYRINQAGDDAAGLAISEQLRAMIRGFRQADRNANDGISMVQVAEGALNEVSNMIIRLRELAIQSASDTLGANERGFVDIEFQQLKNEIQRISDSTQYNGTNLLNGLGGILDIQIGVHNNPFRDRLSFDSSAADSTLESLGLVAESVSTKEAAQMTLQTIDNALTSVSAIRANFGALQNRLISVSNSLKVSEENLSAANSRIRDTDIAAESAEMVRANILQQAAVSVLGQANNSQQLALKLLG
jgi:flagellin